MEFFPAVLLAMFAWFLGGFVNGVAGFGAALVAMPLFTLQAEMSLAVPVCALLVFALNIEVLWSYRKHLQYTGLSFLFWGGFCGAFVGIWLLRHAPEALLKGGLGSVLVLYALWSMCRGSLEQQKPGRFWIGVAGFFSVSLGTAFGINGPPLALYLALRGENSQTTKALFGAFFLVSGLLIMIFHAASGLYTREIFLIFGAALPAALLGCFIGIRTSRHVGERAFRRGFFCLLLLMGMQLCWSTMRR